MSFEWQRELESGIPALDFQHQKIFETIYAFSEKCECGSSPEEIFDLFESIDTFSKKHFSYEENLQQFNSYPGLSNQQNHHNLFLKDLDELKKQLTEDGPTKEIAIAAKDRLVRWWMLHIKNLDRKFIDFLNEKQS